MSAGAALQQAIALRIAAIGGFSGVFDGPPARALFPYVSIDAGSESDWGHKSGEGREVLVAVTLWDDQPARVHPSADAIEAAVLGVGGIEDWQLASLRLLRRRIVRDVAGPWAAAMDFRARLLAAPSGGD